jgi:hypothetical protein
MLLVLIIQMMTFYLSVSVHSMYKAYEQNDVMQELFLDEEYVGGASGAAWGGRRGGGVKNRT